MAFNLFMYNNPESEESNQENRRASSRIPKREIEEVLHKFKR